MDEKNQNKQGQLQIDLPQDVAKGIYSNFAIISHSGSEFTIDFAALLPGLPKASVGARVVMAPEHVKRLLAALQENVIRYEKEFGKIELRGQAPRTAMPFGPQGDA